MKQFLTHRTRASVAGALVILGLAVAGCAGTPATAPPASPTPLPSTTVSAAPGPATLAIVISISGGQVTPNGEKIDVAVGQQVELRVTSDEADEIHAHTGGDGYELEVPAGRPTTGSFTVDSAGSFEVESHHLEKVIVILNAR